MDNSRKDHSPEYIASVMPLLIAKNALLKRLARHEIDLDEFDYECACFAGSTGFEDYHPTPEPKQPYKVQQHLAMSPEDQKEVYAKYHEIPEVKTYYEDLDRIKLRNITNYEWLETWYKIFEKHGDTPNMAKMESRINEYKNHYRQIGGINDGQTNLFNGQQNLS